MARFLCWLKCHNVAHMDIKPANICIDTYTGKLSFIDFGFIGPVCKYSAKYCGTYAFGLPNYLTGLKKIHYEYDMFSCGVSILSFILGKHIDYKKYTRCDEKDNIQRVNIKEFNHELTDILIMPAISAIRTAMRREFDIYIDIIKNMIYYDKSPAFLALQKDTIYPNVINFTKEDKITPEELYNSLPDNNVMNLLRAKYTIECKLSSLEKLQFKSFEIIPAQFDHPEIDEYYANIIDYIYNACVSANYLYLFNYAFKLLQKFINMHSYKEYCNIISHIKGYCIACVFIGNYIFSSRTTDLLTFEDGEILSLNEFSKEEIMAFIENIFYILDWKIYPKKSLVDWNIYINKTEILYEIRNHITKKITKKTVDSIIEDACSNTIKGIYDVFNMSSCKMV